MTMWLCGTRKMIVFPFPLTRLSTDQRTQPGLPQVKIVACYCGLVKVTDEVTSVVDNGQSGCCVTLIVQCCCVHIMCSVAN